MDNEHIAATTSNTVEQQAGKCGTSTQGPAPVTDYRANARATGDSSTEYTREGLSVM